MRPRVIWLGLMSGVLAGLVTGGSAAWFILEPRPDTEAVDASDVVTSAPPQPTEWPAAEFDHGTAIVRTACDAGVLLYDFKAVVSRSFARDRGLIPWYGPNQQPNSGYEAYFGRSAYEYGTKPVFVIEFLNSAGFKTAEVPLEASQISASVEGERVTSETSGRAIGCSANNEEWSTLKVRTP
jgi:hypothetical protein